MRLMKSKTKTLSELSKIVKTLRSQSKKVGLITGCFDILHIGHINLFQEAKRYADILVVGVDNDKSIKLTKGINRPVNNQENRMSFLCALDCVDYVFLIEDIFDFTNEKLATQIQEKNYQAVKPDYLITNKKTDDYWKNKQKSLEKLGIALIDINQKRLGATTKIIEHLLSEL